MPLEASFARFIADLPRLTAEQTPQEVISTTVDTLAPLLGMAKVDITLRAPLGDHAFVQASAGPETEGRTRFVFARPLAVRGQAYGQLQVEVTAGATDPKLLLNALETVAMQLALYAERLALEEQRAELQGVVSALAERLSISKILTRAAGLLAAERRVSLDVGKQILKQEAGRRGVPLLWLADLLITNSRSFSKPGLPAPRGNSRSKGVAA